MRVIMIGENPQRLVILEQALRAAGCIIVAQLASTRDLSLQVGKLMADAVVIDKDLPDHNTLEHIRELKDGRPCPIVMFTQCRDPQTASAALKAGVSSYIVDGLHPERVKSIMDVGIARFQEIRALQEELNKANTNLQERKYIERAKGILMKRTHVEESTAYHTLRKMAMDRNKRIAEVAESIISAEEFIQHGYARNVIKKSFQ